MDKPPKILNKEGVLTRTPGMIKKEKHDNEITEALQQESIKSELGTTPGLIKREKASENVARTVDPGITSGLIKREQSKEKDTVRVQKLRENLGKAFSKEGLLDRNFGKKKE